MFVYKKSERVNISLKNMLQLEKVKIVIIIKHKIKNVFFYIQCNFRIKYKLLKRQRIKLNNKQL